MTVPDDPFIVAIGGERFDPKTRASVARRRANAGKKKLAQVLGVAVNELPGSDREACLIQFAEELDVETGTRFRELYGLNLTQGPDSLTFVEQMTPDTAKRVRRDLAIRSCIAYEPQLKIMSASYEDFVDELEVGLVDGESVEDIVGTLTRMGIDVVDKLDSRQYGGGVSLVVALGDKSLLDAVASLGEVSWVAPRPQGIDNNLHTAAVNQGGTPGTVDSHPIWSQGIHGEGMVIGVIDSHSIDMQSRFYSELSVGGVLLVPPGPTHRKVVSLQVRNAQTLPGFHATAITSGAVGDEDGRSGLNANRGSAWAARLAYSDRFRFETTPVVQPYLADIAAAEAVGARIHSHSWGTLGGAAPASYDQLAADVDGFTFANEDHLMLVAPPNSGDPGFQGGVVLSKNAIAVNATGAHGSENTIADGKHNLTGDGRRKPDMLGVGAGVVTAGVVTAGLNADGIVVPVGRSPVALNTPIAGATSIAAPHVAGAAALVRQYFTEGWYPNGKREVLNEFTPTGALLKAILLNATVNMTGPPGYPSAREGWGRLKLDETLHFDGDKIFLQVWDVRHIVGLFRTGATKAFTLSMPADAKRVKLTLVFSDAPGLATAVDPVVNKLDLEATEPAPSGIGYFANDFGSGKSRKRDFFASGVPPVQPNPADLEKNNVRQILVDSPAPGRWTLIVRAHMVHQTRTPRSWPGIPELNRSQGYALVARVELN